MKIRVDEQKLIRGMTAKRIHIKQKGMTFEQARDKAQTIADDQKKQFKTKQGRVFTNLLYNTGWKPAKSTLLGENVKLFSYDDYDDGGVAKYEQDKFDELIIYILPEKAKTGGNDTYNDCLWRAIRDARNGVEHLPATLQKPEQLKRKLQIPRDSKVNIELIPEVEKIFKLNINVTGDHPHISPKYFKYTIDIELIDEHYQIPKDKMKQATLNKGYSYQRKRLVVYKCNEDTVEIYDGKELKTMSYTEFKDYKKENKYKIILSNAEDLDPKIYYKNYCNDAQVMFKESNGMIDLFKSGFNAQHARALFNLKSGNTKRPELLNQFESEFLQTFASLIYAEPGYFENVTQYDVNSMYPSIMAKIMFPVVQGEFKRLIELPEKPEYGMYRMKVYPSSDPKVNMLFRINDENKYTHYDIMAVKLFNLKYELIQDGQPNALVYSKETLEYGSKLFKPTIDYLYELKLKKVPRANDILKALWGSLCDKQEYKVTLGPNDEPIDEPNIEVTAIYPVNDYTRVCYVKKDTHYLTPYARIGPFLTSYGRYSISRMLYPHKENIVRIHTDGFISKEELEDLKINIELGGMKIEKVGDVFVKNKTRCIWNMGKVA